MKSSVVSLAHGIRFLLYVLVGASGTIVNLVFFYLGEEVIGLPHLQTGLGFLDPLYLSVPFGYQVAIVWNYFLNNQITFRKEAHRGREMLRGFLWFEAFALLSLVLFWFLFQWMQALGFLDTILPQKQALLVYNALSVILSFVGKFLLNVRVTWKT